MLHRLRRHPVPLAARLRHSLVLAYAFPASVLEPLLPTRLTLDRHGEHGLAAAAIVTAERMRPGFLPAAAGVTVHFVGYRIFVRVAEQPSLRGLYVLRTDTDRRLLATLANMTTHYRSHFAEFEVREGTGRLEVIVRSRGGETDLEVEARLDEAILPATSPFADIREARRFAGPLPYTFDQERETGALVAVRGLRRAWEPQPVSVEVRRATFFEREPFSDGVLANAFYVSSVDYRWERGSVL